MRSPQTCRTRSGHGLPHAVPPGGYPPIGAVATSKRIGHRHPLAASRVGGALPPAPFISLSGTGPKGTIAHNRTLPPRGGRASRSPARLPCTAEPAHVDPRDLSRLP